MCCTPTVRWLIVLTLPPPLSLSSQPAFRLLHPRSGLERSDFVLWPIRVISLLRTKHVALVVKYWWALPVRSVENDPTQKISFPLDFASLISELLT